MKLRVRYRKLTRVYDVNDDLKESLTVSQAKEAIAVLFNDTINGDIDLSLNKNTILEDADKLVSDCNVVGGDLIYIITQSDNEESCTVNQQSGQSSPMASNSEASSRCSNSSQSVPQNLEKHPDSSSSSGNLSSKTAHVNNDNNNPQPGCSTNSNEDVSMGTSEENVAMDMGEEEAVDHVIVHQCLSEPVLCREASDGQVPALLREMFEALEPQNKTEALAVVLHVLMLETGFLVLEKTDKDYTGNTPVPWRNTGYLKFTYTYPGCTNIECCLTIIPTGGSVTLHGKVIGTQEATRQCSLEVSSYVHGVTTDCVSCYTGLAKLSRLVKDSIANPLVQDCRTAAGLVDVFGLLALTQEVKLRILSFLNVRSLLQVSRVHSELYELSKDPYLWRRMYLKDFGNRRDNRFSQDWKQLYIREFKVKKERAKMMSRMTMVVPPFFNPQNPFSGPSNWMPPVPGGIIGGDYDLYPNFPSSLPGIPGRMGPQPMRLPRPRYDLIGPGPGVDPGPDPGFIPRRPGGRGRGGPFGGFGPRFF